MSITPDEAKARAVAMMTRSKGFTLSEIYATEYPEPVTIGPFPEGENLLGGRPKGGKSTLMRQFLGACGTGGYFLGKPLPVTRAAYWSFEDNPRAIKRRMGELGIVANENISFYFEWPPFQDSGIPLFIAEFEAGNFKVGVIDTLARAFPGLNQQRDADKLGGYLGAIQKWAKKNYKTIIIIDHLRKPAAGGETNIIDEILGTTNKVGIADSVFGLVKIPGKGTFLQGIGREMDSLDVKLIFDIHTHSWQVDREQPIDGATPKMTALQSAIYDVIEKNRKVQLVTVAECLNRDAGNLHGTLTEMVTMGVIQKVPQNGKVFYDLYR